MMHIYRTNEQLTFTNTKHYTTIICTARIYSGVGADIDAINNDGESPLFYAARKALPAVVRLLLQRNASMDIKDKYGDIAIDHATESRTIQSFQAQSLVADNDMMELQPEINSSPSSSPSSSSISSSLVTSSGMPLSFPYELLLRSIKFLAAKDVCRAACVAGKWHRVCESEEVWSGLGIRRWEIALNSSLGFGPTAASSFTMRPSSGQTKRSKKGNNAIISNSNSSISNAVAALKGQQQSSTSASMLSSKSHKSLL